MFLKNFSMVSQAKQQQLHFCSNKSKELWYCIGKNGERFSYCNLLELCNLHRSYDSIKELDCVTIYKNFFKELYFKIGIV